jgi:hypothetical protein
MRHALVVVGVVGVLCVGVAAQAQENLKKLADWNGEWTFEVQGKDTKDGDPWTVEVKGQQHQIGNDFFVWTSSWTTPEGKEMSDISDMGWDPAKKEYFQVGFRSDGGKGTSVIKFGEDSMTFDGTNTTATGETTRSRCTYTLPTDKYEGKCETLTEGEWWQSSAEKGVRVK